SQISFCQDYNLKLCNRGCYITKDPKRYRLIAKFRRSTPFHTWTSLVNAISDPFEAQCKEFQQSPVELALTRLRELLLCRLTHRELAPAGCSHVAHCVRAGAKCHELRPLSSFIFRGIVGSPSSSGE